MRIKTAQCNCHEGSKEQTDKLSWNHIAKENVELLYLSEN